MGQLFFSWRIAKPAKPTRVAIIFTGERMERPLDGRASRTTLDRRVFDAHRHDLCTS